MKKIKMTLLLCTMAVITIAQEINWQEKKLRDGLVWKSVLGYIDTYGTKHSINIIDVDLNNPNLSIDFINSKDQFTSVDQLVQGSGALVAINGTYPDRDSEGRWGSFFKRKDSIYQTIEYPKSHPLYWKAEGCISIDDRGKVKIRLGNKALYENMTEPYIMSASPVLVQEGVPIGKYFVEGNYTLEELNNLDYEDQIRHQGVRHPRTAIGLTADNHFLMVVVDGRSEQAAGMSARELTTLMYDILDCQQALNLDGGGSSTMWIEGKPDNGVVNYPTDNGKFDHLGTRSISMAVIIKAQ